MTAKLPQTHHQSRAAFTLINLVQIHAGLSCAKRKTSVAFNLGMCAFLSFHRLNFYREEGLAHFREFWKLEDTF